MYYKFNYKLKFYKYFYCIQLYVAVTISYIANHIIQCCVVAKYMMLLLIMIPTPLLII